MRLPIRDGSSSALSATSRRSAVAAPLPLSITGRRSASLAASVSENSARLRAKVWMSPRESIWVSSTVSDSRIAGITSKLASAASMKALPVSTMVPGRAPAPRTPAPRPPSSAGFFLSTEVTSSSTSMSNVVVESGTVVSGERDLAAVGELRPVVRRGLQVDVLLADRGQVATTASTSPGIAGVLRSMSSCTSTPCGVRSAAHPPDGDAAVGDVGAGEDAAGGIEVHHRRPIWSVTSRSSRA